MYNTYAMKYFTTASSLYKSAEPHQVHCRPNRCRCIFVDRHSSNNTSN